MRNYKYRELLDNIYNLDNQCFFKYQIKQEMIQNQSHGCLEEFLNLLSAKKPNSHTKIKANEVNPKKTST